MTGEELKKAVKNSGILIKDLERESKIPEQTIYSLYRKKDVPQHYLEKIGLAGVNLKQTINNYKEPHQMEDAPEIQRKYIKHLEETVEEYKRTISDLRRDVAIEAMRGEIKVLHEVIADLRAQLGNKKPNVQAEPKLTLKDRT